MPKFIGLRALDRGEETYAIVNIDKIACYDAMSRVLYLDNDNRLKLNAESAEKIFNILKENEYKLQGVEE